MKINKKKDQANEKRKKIKAIQLLTKNNKTL